MGQMKLPRVQHRGEKQKIQKKIQSHRLKEGKGLTYSMGVQKEDRENGKKKIFEERVTETFLKGIKDHSPQFQEAVQIPISIK